MFGIDDMISGLVGGAVKMFANQQSNEYQKEAAFQQQAWSQQSQNQSQDYNAIQADLGRQFAREQQNQSMYYNTQEADTARDFSAWALTQAQDFNANQSELNRQFQERMSSTAYQRSRADMAAAGLNPILAANAGGASTPGGSAGSIGAVGGAQASTSAVGAPVASSGALAGARMGDRASMLEGVISSAAEAARLRPQVDQIKQLTAIGQQEETKKRAEKYLTEQLEAESRARTDKTISEKKNVEADTVNKIDQQSQIKFLGTEFNAEKTPRVLQKMWERAQSEGPRALGEMTSSAVSLMRGIWGDGTGGK